MELHPRAGTDLTPDHDGPPDAIRNDSRVIAAYPGRDDEAKLRAAGCDGYISKPIDVARLAEQVRACLPGAAAAAPDVA